MNNPTSAGLKAVNITILCASSMRTEKETPKDVSLNKISKVADVLGVSVDSLLQETPPDLMDTGDEIAIEKFNRLDGNRRLKVKEFIELLG